jgi:hypothetical protein
LLTQPLNLQSDLLVSKFASKFNWYRYDEEETNPKAETKQGLEGLDGLTDSETPINVSGGDDVLNETDGTVNDTESGLGMTMIRLGYRARNFEVGESSCRAPCGCVRRAGSNFWWGCTTS